MTSRNGVGSSAPFLTMRTTPSCSTMKRRFGSSGGAVTKTGRVEPARHAARVSSAVPDTVGTPAQSADAFSSWQVAEQPSPLDGAAVVALLGALGDAVAAHRPGGGVQLGRRRRELRLHLAGLVLVEGREARAVDVAAHREPDVDGALRLRDRVGPVALAAGDRERAAVVAGLEGDRLDAVGARAILELVALAARPACRGRSRARRARMTGPV